MAGPDLRSLKLVLRAAKPGRDRLLVLTAIATAGRMPVDELRTLTVLQARTRLTNFNHRHFVSTVLTELNDPLWQPDDYLFPSRKRDIQGRLQPIGRAAAWKVVHDAVVASGVAKRSRSTFGSGFLILEHLMSGRGTTTGDENG